MPKHSKSRGKPDRAKPERRKGRIVDYEQDDDILDSTASIAKDVNNDVASGPVDVADQLTHDPRPSRDIEDADEVEHQRRIADAAVSSDIIAAPLILGKDYRIEASLKFCYLTDAGRERVKKLARITLGSFTSVEAFKFVENSLAARVAYIKGRDYHVVEGEIVPVDDDESLMRTGLSFREGILRAIQTKEGLEIRQSMPSTTESQMGKFVEQKFTTDILIKHDIRNKYRVPLPQPSQPHEEPPIRSEDKRAEYLAALLDTAPASGGYAEQARSLEELSHGFRRELAARLRPILVAHLQAMPHATHEEKKALVKWANVELRRFGLAVKSPKTGNASNFVTDKGNHPEKGRFQLRSEGEGGKVETFSTPELSALLEVFELIEAPQREEGLVNWADRAKDAARQTKPHR